MGLRGSLPSPNGRRARQRRALDLPPERPTCPDYLSDRAKEIWTLYVEYLMELRNITKFDFAALARLCSTTARYESLSQEIDHGVLFKTQNNKAGHPYVTVSESMKLLRQLGSDILKLEIEFGLTPKSRMRQLAHRSPETDPETEEATNKFDL